MDDTRRWGVALIVALAILGLVLLARGERDRGGTAQPAPSAIVRSLPGGVS